MRHVHINTKEDEEEEKVKTFDGTGQREARKKGAGSHRYIIIALLLAFSALNLGSDCWAIGNFFGEEISWKGYKEGLDQAKREGRPALIIFYSETCSACKRYKSVLQDKRIVEASGQFVMIRVNTRQQPKLNQQYLFDGSYVPRTFAVFPDGRIMHQLYPPKRYKYFIGLEPDNLLSLMKKVRAEIKR